ncbi:MAG: FHA domain-containing protein [Phycisphaerales bacterium]|nr:FHA domain-containing protein [Phycisphaerales bacterium]
MKVTLVLVKEDGSTQELPLKKARLVIGRQKGVDLRIPVPEVSREHCEVRLDNGSVSVRDLGSSNGTYVNRARVQDGKLNAGDLLAVGPAVFVVRVNGEPADIDAEDAWDEGAAPKAVAAVKPAASARPSGPGAAGGPKERKKPSAASLDPNDSSITGLDFDFLGKDEEEGQPKL